MSYNDFNKYLDATGVKNSSKIIENILYEMKNVAQDCMRSVFNKIDPNRKCCTFEIFGFDFMIGENYKV